VIDSLLPFISFTQTQWDVSSSHYEMDFLITYHRCKVFLQTCNLIKAPVIHLELLGVD